MHIKWESRKGQGSEIVYYRPGYNVKTMVFLKCKLHVGRKEEGGEERGKVLKFQCVHITRPEKGK